MPDPEPPTTKAMPDTTSSDIEAAAIAAVAAVFKDAGKAENVDAKALRDGIARLIKRLLHPRPTPPPYKNFNIDLNAIATLMAAQSKAANVNSASCCVFLGAGVHFGPPDPPPHDRELVDCAGHYSDTIRPPVGSELAVKLDEDCLFTTKFPWENNDDWMRVATWHEKEWNRGGDLGLETCIKKAVEIGKQGSCMLSTIASWPCRYFYTTNFDTHLEKELLKKHEALWVWIYSPHGDEDLRECWYELKRGEEKPVRWQSPASSVATNVPPEPPDNRPFVFKLHGCVTVDESIVITDNDYITFLRRIARRELPSVLLQPLGKSILFIGYSLKDYNMRYVLSLLREDDAWMRKSKHMSFSVDLRPDPIVQEVWQNKSGLIKFIEDNLWFVIPSLDALIKKKLAKT